MISFFSQRKTKKTISGFLSFWLSGLVILFCCGMMEAPADAEFCPLAKAENHCDKANTETDSPTFSGESGQTIDCCAFLPALFDKARKIEKNQQPAEVPAKLKIELPQMFLAQNDFQIAETYEPPAFGQNKVFIKNCVFRI